MTFSLSLTVNGDRRDVELDDPRVTLLDLLRERLALTGTKKGCDRGQCGACTVLVDGRRINACLALAVEPRRRRGRDDRGPRRRRRAASGAGRLHRPRRLPVRLLHAGPDHERGRPDPRGRGRRRPRAHPRGDERQPLPLRRLCRHHRGGARGASAASPTTERRMRMNRFDYVRPASVAEAIAAAAEPGRRLSRRRHQPARPDEDRRRPARAGSSTSPGCPASTGSRCCPTAASGSARWSATPTSPAIAAFARAYPGGRRGAAVGRLGAAAQRRDRRRQPACSARAAPISTTPPAPATGASRAPAATRAGGENRGHAILGWSDACIATHPSDFCVPLVALDAVVEIEGPAGRRDVAARGLPPPARRHARSARPRSRRASSIVALRLPAEAAAFRGHSRYLKLRERTSFAFALVSAAAASRSTDGRIRRARLALGGVAAKPWRARAAEAALDGRRAGPRRLRPRRRGRARRRAALRRQRPQDRAREAPRRARAARSPPPGRPSACPPCPPPSSPIPEPSPMPDTLPPPPPTSASARTAASR